MRKNAITAASLSIVPGLGHLYIRDFKKGLALLCISAGVVLTWIFLRSPVILMVSVLIYSATMGPAVFESYQAAKTGKAFKGLDAPWYVISMLLVTGFSALPLLWQSERFSKTSKIAWTVAVPVLAVIFFGTLGVWGRQIDSWLLHRGG